MNLPKVVVGDADVYRKGIDVLLDFKERRGCTPEEIVEDMDQSIDYLGEVLDGIAEQEESIRDIPGWDDSEMAKYRSQMLGKLEERKASVTKARDHVVMRRDQVKAKADGQDELRKIGDEYAKAVDAVNSCQRVVDALGSIKLKIEKIAGEDFGKRCGSDLAVPVDRWISAMNVALDVNKQAKRSLAEEYEELKKKVYPDSFLPPNPAPPGCCGDPSNCPECPEAAKPDPYEALERYTAGLDVPYYIADRGIYLGLSLYSTFSGIRDIHLGLYHPELCEPERPILGPDEPCILLAERYDGGYRAAVARAKTLSSCRLPAWPPGAKEEAKRRAIECGLLTESDFG